MTDQPTNRPTDDDGQTWLLGDTLPKTEDMVVHNISAGATVTYNGE